MSKTTEADYLETMRLHLSVAEDNYRIAENRQGESHKQHMENVAHRRELANVYALASIAESLATIAVELKDIRDGVVIP